MNPERLDEAVKMAEERDHLMGLKKNLETSPEFIHFASGINHYLDQEETNWLIDQLRDFVLSREKDLNRRIQEL